MSLLEELKAVAEGLGLPVGTGFFSGEPPPEYAVLTPLDDEFTLCCDDEPEYETQEVRVSIFTKGNYTARVRELVKALFNAEIDVTARHYAGYESDVGYHNYAVDAAKIYYWGDGE